jgi:hypothetical protein
MAMKVKALVVKVPNRSDWDLGDVLAIARSEGKKLFKTNENVRVVWIHETLYGHVVLICLGCNQNAGCKREVK